MGRTHRQGRTLALVSALLMAATLLRAGPAAADPVEDFYKGKTIQMVIGFSPGGDYDLRARLLARYLGKYIPGNPNIVAVTMTGAGGLVAANWLANVAPQDGTALLAISSFMPVAQALGLPGIKFDARKFQFIGNTINSPNVINSWHTTGITNVKQVMNKELALGGTGRSGGSYYYPTALNAWAGTKFKIISGYRGGSNANVAMERGEVGGRSSNMWASWKSTKPDWLKDKKIHILVQVGLKRHPELPDVPLMQELVHDDKKKQAMIFLSADTAIARPIVAAPRTPPERVAALRKAFDQAMKDPDLLADARKAKQEIDPTPGVEVQKIVDSIVNADQEVIELSRSVLLDSGSEKAK